VEGPDAVHLARWPEVAQPDRALLGEIDDVRRVVALAHQARATAGLKLRQPLRRLTVEGAERAQTHAGEIADEVRVKEVVFAAVDADLRVKPNLPVLGPRLGKELRAVQEALARGDFEQLDGGRCRVAGGGRHARGVRRGRGGRAGPALTAAGGGPARLAP